MTEKGFVSALDNVGSVVLIPGGQEEMIGSHSNNTRVPINTRHKGFVRIALKTGSSLVPIYSFGETQVFDNMPWPVWLQRWYVLATRQI